MRPNDFCHPNELRAPAPRRVPGSGRHFRGGDSARLLRRRAVIDRGTGGFHDLRDRFGGYAVDAALVLYCLATWRHERGRFLPTASACDRASGIPVAEPRSPSASLAFACAASSPDVLLAKG